MSIHRARIAAASLLVALLLQAERPAAAGCTLTKVTPIGFGGYDPTSATPVDSTGELAIECDVETPVRVSLGRGISGRQVPRELRSGKNSLAYNLYLDAARTAIWGDGSEGTQVFQGLVPRRGELRLPIFARMLPRQQVPPGVYRDRVMVAVVY